MDWQVNLMQMTIISNTVGKNPLEEMEQPSQSAKKSLKCSTWKQSQKRQNDLCSFPRQSIQYHGYQIYASTNNDEERLMNNDEVEWFYEDLQDLLELTSKKDVLFITGDWNAKARN